MSSLGWPFQKTRLGVVAPTRRTSERYGKYKTVYKRFTRWAAAGVWEQVFAMLVKDRGNHYLLIARPPRLFEVVLVGFGIGWLYAIQQAPHERRSL